MLFALKNREAVDSSTVVRCAPEKLFIQCGAGLICANLINTRVFL